MSVDFKNFKIAMLQIYVFYHNFVSWDIEMCNININVY